MSHIKENDYPASISMMTRHEDMIIRYIQFQNLRYAELVVAREEGMMIGYCLLFDYGAKQKSAGLFIRLLTGI
jgi:hypothetical protein